MELSALADAVARSLHTEGLTAGNIEAVRDALTNVDVTDELLAQREPVLGGIGVPSEHTRMMVALERSVCNIQRRSLRTRKLPERPQGKEAAAHRRKGNATTLSQPQQRAVDVLVVGAGTNGLAIAACVQQSGLTVAIIEKDTRVGNVWRNRYDRLHVHNLTDACALPFLPPPESAPAYLSKDDLAQYMEGYAVLMGLTIYHGHVVTSACFDEREEYWTVQVEDAGHTLTSFESKALVVASGFYGAPKIPAVPGLECFQGSCIHSADYKNGCNFSGQKVLVVGIGNSGCEQALDLWEHGAHPSISVRTPPVVVPRWIVGWQDFIISQYQPAESKTDEESTICTILWDEIFSWVSAHTYSCLEAECGLSLSPERVSEYTKRKKQPPVIDVGTMALIAAHEIPVLGHIRSFSADGVSFMCGKDAEFDAVLWATGYERGTCYADYLDEATRDKLEMLQREDPMLAINNSNPLPYLYFAMNPSLASPRRTAPKLASKISRDVMFPTSKVIKIANSPHKMAKLQTRLKLLHKAAGQKRMEAAKAT